MKMVKHRLHICRTADCLTGCTVSAEPAGRQADRAGLRAGGPGEAAVPPGHAAGHLGGRQEVSRVE